MADFLKNTIEKISKKSGLLFTFLRAQLSSQLSSITDFTVTIVLAKVFESFLESIFGEYYYGFATGAGAICGGIVNCIINYKWTFKAQGVNIKYVIIKYILVWIGSILLNMGGTILLTELMKDIVWIQNLFGHYIDYFFLLPKIIVSLLVGFIWNFNMQRLFVYRDVDIKGIFKKKDKHI